MGLKRGMRYLLYFGRELSPDPNSRPLSPVPTNSSEKNQVQQKKDYFINHNQLAHIGLELLAFTGRFFFWLIWSSVIHFPSHVIFSLTLSINVFSVVSV